MGIMPQAHARALTWALESRLVSVSQGKEKKSQGKYFEKLEAIEE